MTALPHKHGSAGARAGIPLARAQRLAANRTAPPPKRSRLPLVLTGAALCVLGASAFGPASQGLEPLRSLVAKVAEQATAAEPEEVTVEPATIDFTALPQLAPSCVIQVVDGVRALHGPGSAPQDADAGALSSLIGAASECQHTEVSVDGSLELVRLQLADVHVHWSDEARHLHVSVINGQSTEETPTVYSETGLPIDFFIR